MPWDDAVILREGSLQCHYPLLNFTMTFYWHEFFCPSKNEIHWAALASGSDLELIVCVCMCVCVWRVSKGDMEMCEYTGVRWSVGNREEPALSHIDSGSAGHTRERLTDKSNAITFRSGCSMSSFVTEALSKWEVTVLKGVGRLPQPSPPLQGAFPVRGPSGNEKCLLYGGHDGVSGPTASAPVRLPLCRHRSLAALASARCGLLSRSRSSSSRSCSHGPCGAALRKEVSLPPSYPEGHSWGKRSSPRPCASGGRWLPPIRLPSPRCASHSLLSPQGRRRASWKVWRKRTWPVAPELWERESFCPWRKRQGHLCRSQFSGLPSPLFSRI